MFDRRKSSRLRKLMAGDQQVGATGRRARPVSSSSHMPYACKNACKSRMMLDVAATFRVWRLERRFENVDSRFAGQKSSAGSLGASEYGDGTRSREASRTEKRWQDISASLNIAEKGGTPMRPWIGNHGFIAVAASARRGRSETGKGCSPFEKQQYRCTRETTMVLLPSLDALRA